MPHQPALPKSCPTDCLVLNTRPELAQPDGHWIPTVTVNDERERRFRSGYRCPRCGSDHIHGHGRYRDRRRYRCVECGRTFNDRTGSPLSGTHYPERWGVYIACMAGSLHCLHGGRVLTASYCPAARHQCPNSLLLASQAAGRAHRQCTSRHGPWSPRRAAGTCGDHPAGEVLGARSRAGRLRTACASWP